MGKKIKIYGTLLFFSLMTLNFISCSTDDGEIIVDEPVALSQEEVDMLIQMREEEKLARDVYDYLYSRYALNVFDNISNSEQMHMDRVLGLLNQYNIPDPALPNPGEFSSQTLQDLYDQLTSEGDIALINALKVGATVEDLDIFDLEDFSSKTQNQDILDVFSNLTCGSRNHLRGFYNQILNEGDDYSPQFISQTEFDDIVNSSHEQCNN